MQPFQVARNIGQGRLGQGLGGHGDQGHEVLVRCLPFRGRDRRQMWANRSPIQAPDKQVFVGKFWQINVLIQSALMCEFAEGIVTVPQFRPSGA